MKKEFISDSPESTASIAESFSKTLKGGEILSFYGDLGLGKTCFIKGLAKGLGYTGNVTSPTFDIVNEYRGGRLDLFHFDMYRISGWDDLFTTGYFEYADEGGVIATEWSENIENAIPDDSIRITLERINDTTRKITIERREQDENTCN